MPKTIVRYTGGEPEEIIDAMLFALKKHGIDKLPGKGGLVSLGGRTVEAPLLHSALEMRIAHAASVERKVTAWVPVHPKYGPLWNMATANPAAENLTSYPLMPLFAGPRDRVPIATPEAGLDMARAAFVEAARWSDQAPLVEERARMYFADGTWSEEEYLEWKGEHEAWSRDVAEQFEDFVKRYHKDAARAGRTEGGA